MNDEALLFLIQPISFTRHVYTSLLKTLNNMDEHVLSTGYVNTKKYAHEETNNFLFKVFDAGPQSTHIDFLVKNIAYEFGDAFLEALCAKGSACALEGIKIDPQKSFLNIYIVDDSVFTLSMQLCVQYDVTKQNDSILQDIILQFRNILDSENGIYADIKKLIFSDILKTLKHLDVKASDTDVSILPHSAHIFSSFMHAYDAKKAACINSIHNKEEGEPYEYYKLPETLEEYFLRFGWSYTSMYAISYDECIKNLQLSIHLGARWFFWRYFNSSSYDHLKVIMNESLNMNAINATLSEHNTLAVIARILEAKDFQFISTLKPWQEKIYTFTQVYWKIPDLRREALMTFETAKEVTQRKMEQYSQKVQKKHSSILFVIALMETFSIMGYINDYLSIIDIDTLPKKLYFIDPAFFSMMSIYMPFILLGLFFFILIYITEFGMGIFRKRK